MRSRRRRLRMMLALGVGAALSCVALVLPLTNALGQLELDTIDARFSLRATQPPPPDVVVVHVDDKTFQDLDEQWPFPRHLHARAIDALQRAGAKVIAYDVQFTEETTPREDTPLIESVGRAAGRVVLASTEGNSYGESLVFGGPENVEAVNARVGSALLPLDSDGVIRRLPRSVGGMTGFAVAAAEAAGRPASFTGDTAWIDFRGPPGAVDTVSFSTLLSDGVDPARFRDKVVVVGTSAPSVQDVHATSVSSDRPMSGAEIQANAIATLLDGAPLHRTPTWVACVLVLVFGMIPPLAAIRLRSPLGLLAVPAAALLYAVVVQLAFNAGLILPLLYPLIALVLSGIGVLVVAYSSAAFERERVRELFSRFVPESVVKDVLASTGDDLRLVAQRVQATIVFCDIRGFTSYAELRPAEQVIAVLNHHLEQMTEAIRERGGTVVAYQGDGLLAAFGAPVEQFDHADRALDAVRDMAGPRLAEVNAWLREHGFGDGFRVGIGVNSGTVMSGNIGSEWRVEYTTIGDPVNTASRLESLTKDVPYQVLISDTTRAMLRREVTWLRYVDVTEIRGKQIKANLWTIDEDASD